MAEAARAGVIGPSGIGRVHIECLHRLGVEVQALTASSPARSTELASELGVPIACGDARELVAREDLDVVHICSPPNLHAEQAMLAIEAGKHVVCEKPLATSAVDADRLLAAATANDVVHAVAYNYRFYPMLQAARARVFNADLGRLHLVRGAYLIEELLLVDDPDSWLLDPARAGSALALADVGVHWWDLVEFVTGQLAVEVLCAFQVARNPAVTGEDSAAVMMRLDSGAIAVGVISTVAPGHGNTITIELTGMQASALWNQDEPDRLWLGPLGMPTQLIWRSPQPDGVVLPSTLQLPAGMPQGYLDAFRDLLASIYAAVAGDRNGPTFPTFADGSRGIHILEAMIESGHSQSWVNVRGPERETIQ